jgi:hypothetical protein
MKNAVFCDIKPQFIPNRRHSTSPLQWPAGYCYVRFEGFTAVTVKNAVIKNPSSYLREDTLRLHYRTQPVNAM